MLTAFSIFNFIIYTLHRHEYTCDSRDNETFFPLAIYIYLRVTVSEVAKFFKIQKVPDFIHFKQKNTHINQCKNIQVYKNATVIVHICTVTVALHFII